MGNNNDKQQEQHVTTRMTPPLLETNSSSLTALRQALNPAMTAATEKGGASTPQATVWNQLGPLTQLTRPQNFPGIFCFHVLGIYIALQSANRMDLFVTVLLAKPSMWLVLSAVILVSCTSVSNVAGAAVAAAAVAAVLNDDAFVPNLSYPCSFENKKMVVNDYYDAKLGRDTSPDRPLVTGDLSFPLVRRYLSYLYAAALICGALLPGAPARLAVMLSLMLTYWYTNHLKPLTWVKNAVCAFLIAFAPLTSGSAALHLAYTTTTTTMPALSLWRMGPIWRAVAMLFWGFLGREMTMDCNDVENDRAVGVQTIPVVYGPAFASRVALGCAAVAAGLAMAGPLRDMTTAAVPTAVWARRLGFAVAGSAIQLAGAWRVWQTEGRDRNTVNWAVDSGVKTILLFLASYL